MMIYPENALVMAPLAGYTDIPFRRMMRRHGARFLFTEMVDVDSLIYNTSQSLTYVDKDSTDTWLALQLVGHDPNGFDKIAQRIRNLNYQVIDFNLGCPVPKVMKKGEGAILARREPEHALRCVERLVKLMAPTPVSVKMRILSETDPEPTVQFSKALESIGIQALTIHGRLMERIYSGPVFFDALAAVNDAISIPLIVNGGVMGLDSYREICTKTGCSRVMLARGAQGNPWLFEELGHPDTYVPPTIAEFADELQLYLEDVCAYYGVELGLRICRKTVLDFLRGRGFPGSLRARISTLSTPVDVALLLSAVREGPSPDYFVHSERAALPRRIRA